MYMHMYIYICIINIFVAHTHTSNLSLSLCMFIIYAYINVQCTYGTSQVPSYLLGCTSKWSLYTSASRRTRILKGAGFGPAIAANASCSISWRTQRVDAGNGPNYTATTCMLQSTQKPQIL